MFVTASGIINRNAAATGGTMAPAATRVGHTLAARFCRTACGAVLAMIGPRCALGFGFGAVHARVVAPRTKGVGGALATGSQLGAIISACVPTYRKAAFSLSCAVIDEIHVASEAVIRTDLKPFQPANIRKL